MPPWQPNSTPSPLLTETEPETEPMPHSQLSNHFREQDYSLRRRSFLKGLVGAAAGSVSYGALAQSSAESIAIPSFQNSGENLAQDEHFWRGVASYYEVTEGIINLEHGYWGKMARPVQEAYLQATRMVNAQNSFYARKDYRDDYLESNRRAAEALGAEPEELTLTRNASEAIHNLMRQYRELREGDQILYADIDYPSFKESMAWLEIGRGVEPIKITLPSRANQSQILQLYVEAFEQHPQLKLILLTHVSNQQGLVLPVAEITAAAKQRGIDVICDCAQSWGLLNYKISEIQVDWAGFNLHKWIGSPLGVGALYMRKGSLSKIAPYPGETDPENQSVYARVHTATLNFAALLAIPAALDFHQAIGGENKEARLRYLRQTWTAEAESINHIELLGGLDEASWTGMGSFRLRGQTSLTEVNQLQQRLEHEFGIFTVVRRGLDSGACIRVTPQVFTPLDDISQLLDAMKQLSS